MKQIPNTLREHRKRAGLLQSDIAQKLGLKSTDRISHWEKGLAYPSVINLFKLAKLYGVRPDELYGDMATESQPEILNNLISEKYETLMSQPI